MTIHRVNKQALEQIFTTTQERAQAIVRQVDDVQSQLAQTTYTGANADELAQEMNTKMELFVAATHAQLDALLRVVTDNMNVVVTKLGSPPWNATPVAAMALNHRAQSQDSAGGTLLEINTQEMAGFADLVGSQFTGIANSYTQIEQAIGSDGRWVGPERDATVAAVTNAVATIVPEVHAVGASLQNRILEQASAMSS